MISRYYIVIIGYLFFLVPLFSQPVIRHYERITSDQGLSQNLVWTIFQDHEGYLWFGTKDGLNKFDGNRFSCYRYNPGDSNSISWGYTMSLHECDSGVLWIGLATGNIDLFDKKTERVYHLILPAVPTPDNVISAIQGIVERSTTEHWVRTNAGSLYRINGSIKFPESTPPVFENLQISTFDSIGYVSLTKGHHYTISIDATGMLFMDVDGGVLGIRGDSMTCFIPYPELRKPSPNNQFIDWKSAFDKDSSLWIAFQSTLYRVDKITHTVTTYPLVLNPNDTSSTTQRSLQQDMSHAMWAVSHQTFFRVNLSTHSVDELQRIPALEGDPTVRILSLLCDEGGVIWLGTPGDGIFKFNPAVERFGALPGLLWGTIRDSAYAFFYNAKRYPLRAGEPPRMQFSEKNVYRTSGGRYWIQDKPYPTKDYERLCLCDSSGNLLKSYDSHSPPFRNKEMYFRSMTEDNTGNLWLATFNTITRFDPQTETSEDFYFTKDSLKKLPVFTHIIPDAIIIGNATLNDDDGSFWFGSDTRGLYQFNYTTNRLRSFWNPSNDSAYLSHNDVISLCNDPDNPQQYLWVGTEGGGLNKLDKTTGKVIRYTTSIGLPNNVINGMLFDKEKNMWVSTNHGICKFNPATLTVKCFDVNDGLQGNEFDRFKYFESAEGMMFFGGVNGVNYFYPDKIEDNHHIPQVVITDVRLQNRSVLVRDRHLLRTYTSTNSNTLTIPYSENIISVEFAALDFSNPNKNLFSHKLDGFNKDWSYPTTERTVTYTNLDPGKYVFHIRGSNNDGVWNMNGASLTFIILPPWYRTWWFYALSFIAIAGTIIGIIWYRFKQLERARQVQEDFARALMENQEAERKRISGELHDSVGQNILLIKNRAHFGVQGVQDLPSAHLQLNEIATLAADTLNQVREISHNLRPLHLDRLGLTQAIYMLLDQVEHNSTIKITSSINEIDNRVPKESEVNIFRIVQECLNNILKHAQAKNVTVTVTLEPEYIQIIIQDDGVGFDFDQKQRLTKNYGMGLSGLSERAKIIGGNLTIESSPGNGTKVLLKIPVSQTKI